MRGNGPCADRTVLAKSAQMLWGAGMRFAGIMAVLMLSACVMGGVKDKPAPAANPITGAPIATTSLDAPVANKAPPSRPDAAKPATEIPKPTDVKPEAAPAEAPEEVVVELSPEAAKCAKTGGTWSGVGKSGGKACVKPTRDSGKTCSKQTQCEGLCLARSGTCAPITPMFGCNEILQADGRRVTLCID